MKVGIVQVCSGSDPWANLETVSKFIKQAEAKKCDLVCFPENIFYRGPRNQLRAEFFLELDNQNLKVNSDFSKKLIEMLKKSKVAVSLGSVSEVSENPQCPFNSHFFVTEDRKFISYRKINLFCFLGSAANYDEAKFVTPGTETVSVPCLDFQFGLSICYDIRFPELYRKLSIENGANVLLIPAAFTFETGQAHWHSLLRARAIENLSYVLAAGQWGDHQNDEGKTLSCYGHSLAYSPWGDLLAEAPEREDQLLLIDLDPQKILDSRKRLPGWRGRN